MCGRSLHLTIEYAHEATVELTNATRHRLSLSTDLDLEAKKTH